MENMVYDAASGQPMSASLMDYALPRADDIPPFEITLVETPTAINPLGVKGSGQAGCIGAPQTVIHAILDALAPLGIEHIDMPATPERIWRAIRAARR
jgi:carbon-monoxide dehydrogenase large subunit